MEFRLKSMSAFRGQVHSIIICPIMEEYTEIDNNKQFLESPSCLPHPLNEACYDKKGQREAPHYHLCHHQNIKPKVFLIQKVVLPKKNCNIKMQRFLFFSHFICLIYTNDK